MLSGLRESVENAYAIGTAAVPPEACIWSNLATNLLTLSYMHLPNSPAAGASEPGKKWVWHIRVKKILRTEHIKLFQIKICVLSFVITVIADFQNTRLHLLILDFSVLE